jgi:hypothetical protein
MVTKKEDPQVGLAAVLIILVCMSNQFHFLIREITMPQLIYDILNLTSTSSYNRGFNNPVKFASFAL